MNPQRAQQAVNLFEKAIKFARGLDHPWRERANYLTKAGLRAVDYGQWDEVMGRVEQLEHLLDASEAEERAKTPEARLRAELREWEKLRTPTYLAQRETYLQNHPRWTN